MGSGGLKRATRGGGPNCRALPVFPVFTRLCGSNASAALQGSDGNVVVARRLASSHLKIRHKGMPLRGKSRLTDRFSYPYSADQLTLIRQFWCNLAIRFSWELAKKFSSRT